MLQLAAGVASDVGIAALDSVRIGPARRGPENLEKSRSLRIKLKQNKVTHEVVG